MLTNTIGYVINRSVSGLTLWRVSADKQTENALDWNPPWKKSIESINVS